MAVTSSIIMKRDHGQNYSGRYVQCQCVIKMKVQNMSAARRAYRYCVEEVINVNINDKRVDTRFHHSHIAIQIKRV